MTMELEPIKHGDVVVLAPQGSLNTETSPKLEQKVIELLNASERWFAIDFARVDYISSAGLRILLMMAKRLRGMGGAMALCSLKEDVRKVFALCGFERDFTIVANRTEALERLFTGTAAPAADAGRVAPSAGAPSRVATAHPAAAAPAPVAPEPVAAAPVADVAPPPAAPPAAAVPPAAAAPPAAAPRVAAPRVSAPPVAAPRVAAPPVAAPVPAAPEPPRPSPLAQDALRVLSAGLAPRIPGAEEPVPQDLIERATRVLTVA